MQVLARNGRAQRRGKPVTMDRRRLLPLVCQHFDVATPDVLSRNRTTRVVEARHTCFYLLHRYGETLSDIGRDFDRNHSDVHHALKSVEARLVTSRRYIERLAALENVLERMGWPVPQRNGQP
jgi:chromosomal replication initiation ATPase DnaA